MSEKRVKPKIKSVASRTNSKNRRTKTIDRKLVKKTTNDSVSKKRVIDKVEVAQLLKKLAPSDFGKIFFSDNFSNNVLHFGYREFPEGYPERYGIESGWLAILAPMGQDLWGGVPLKMGAPLLLHTAPTGNYGVECTVDAMWNGVAQRINTQVGLFVFEDVKNWLFFGFSHHSSQQGAGPQGGGLMITETIGDISKIRHLEDFPPMISARLGIERAGNYWRFYIKEESWRQLGPDIFGPFGSHEVGMGVKSFQDSGSPQMGYFDNFIIRTN